MSAISTNPFPTGFAAAPQPNEPFAAETGAGRALPSATADTVAPLASFGNGDATIDPATATTGASGGLAGFESLMSGFITNIRSLLASLGQSFGLGGASSSPTSPGGEHHYADATAGSVGDPHESFHGTGSDGTVDGKWDSMRPHGDLLDSDSFGGGYRISTTVTAPNADGVTFNERATVTTDGGNSSVSMNADGSYDVRSGGSAVTLTTGTAVSLSDGETVTLDADKSLTVDDANASGGSISTTLRSNGDGGVDVSSTAHDVDLGGYLATRGRDAGGGDPQRPHPTAVQTSASDGIFLA